MGTNIKNHKHTWIVSSIAIVIAVILLILMPHQKGYSVVMIGIAGGHVILALIAIFTGWLFTPQRLINKLFKRTITNDYDFGWSYKWIYGFLLASLIVFILAIHVCFSLAGSPLSQFLAYTVLLLLALNLFIGNAIIRNSNRTARITLPMVNFPANGGNKVLDAGCGAGRTTIALAQALPDVQITALDRFDAGYIDDGGLTLLKRNLKLAGINEKVSIVTGDITKTHFEDNRFDGIVSSFMFDHLGKEKQQALKESYRILKPRGRFLLVILVRGYIAFGVASILSLMITSRSKWKKWIEEAGFKMISEGNINEGAYFLFEK